MYKPKRLRPSWFIAAFVLLLAAGGCTTSSNKGNGSTTPDSSTSSGATQPNTVAFKPEACGSTQLDTITLVWRDKGKKPQTRQVATFYPWGCPGKTDHCAYTDGNRSFPETACSPGAIYDLTGNTDPRRYNEQANQDVICQTRANAANGEDRRDVTTSKANRIWDKYDQRKGKVGSYETDHRVPISLGGSNAEGNLFPELAAGKYGFRQKDKIEAQLAQDICDKTATGTYKLSLNRAEHQVAYEWTSLYDQMVRDGRIKA